MWRWPNGIVPYVISDDDFPPDTAPAERAAVETAVAEWNQHGLVHLRERDDDRHWIVFVAATEDDACSSHVGMKQGVAGLLAYQKIPCNPLGTALVHEIGHAVGLWHEQQRQDRDEWITVHLENLRSDKRGNFDRHVGDGNDIGVYDYDSVMHYSSRTFAVDWPLGSKLPGQSSGAAPALASLAGELHLLHLGKTSESIWHTWTIDGSSWTDNVRLPNQTSKALPALTAFRGALHMVHLGKSSNDIWHSSSADLRTWSQNTRTGQTSKAAPAIAEFNGELHMVHIGDESNSLWHSWTVDGNSWTELKIPDQTTRVGPALAVFNGELHLVHLGNTSDDLWHSWSADGRSWTPNVRIEDQRSRATPALCAFDGRLHLAHIGESSNTIWHSAFDGTDWAPNNRKDNNQSAFRPALAAFDARLQMAYRGTSDEREIRHTVRDTLLMSFDAINPPAGVVPGDRRGSLSQGDLRAVQAMYPSQPQLPSPWLDAILHMMVPAGT